MAILNLIALAVFSQQRYWVFFRDKKGVEFNPVAYFDQKAIDRRIRMNLPLYSESDYPVSPDYIAHIEKITGKVLTICRWLNAVTVEVPPDKLETLTGYDFVTGLRQVEFVKYDAFCDEGEAGLTEDKMELMRKQLQRMGGDIFKANGIDGRGVRIAVFDGGFPGVDEYPEFRHLVAEGRIIKTYDFVRKKKVVYDHIPHGTMVLSCIAGIHGDARMGLATGAEFLLALTERKGEHFSEEENWLAAVEWADKNGADIINSSLGYTYKRYFPTDMDGHTSLVARAAELAAGKGMLVVNAMGNDGNRRWEFMGTPADADSVLSVGGIDPNTDYHIRFSSYGPTSDMRRKPNVSAYAEVIAVKKDKAVKTQGTSFSTPLVTGFAACIMQMNPNLTNMEVFSLIEQSGHLYPYFDYAHGYGIPQADFFYPHTDSVSCVDTVHFDIEEDTLRIMVNETTVPDADPSKNLLYYHIAGANDVLERYSVVDAEKPDVVDIPEISNLTGKILRVHFRGCTIEHKF